jgi:hypothetical protein
MVVRSHLCERARLWASLRVDGELSELEGALLGAHLERCADCRTFARGVDTVARGLRVAALERPAPRALPVPRHHSKARLLQLAAATAAIVAAGAAAALTGSGNSPPTAVKQVAMVAAADSPDRLRELRRPALVHQGRPPVQPQTRRLVAEPV